MGASASNEGMVTLFGWAPWTAKALFRLIELYKCDWKSRPFKAASAIAIF
jgi:hypothetical protein